MISEPLDNSASHRILLVDDDAMVLSLLAEYLESHGYLIGLGDCRQEAEDLLKSGAFDAAILDYELPDGNALDILKWLRVTDTDVPVIILTGNATIDLAVRAIQEGAEHFLTKPVEMAALEVVLLRTLENRRNRRQQRLRRERRSASGLDPFVGRSAKIQELHEVASRLAKSDSPVRIHGETGTGKGVLARWLHDNSSRADEAFVDINCAGLSPEFLDSELFGHQRGAFTGATANKSGLLEVAHRGTVFLDEIGDVDMQVQPKLLKVLEEKRFRRLGEVRERDVDIRLIAASHQDLRKSIQEGRFREDLYFRINTLPLEIPPLRKRREDIAPLAETILSRFAQELGRPLATLSRNGVTSLENYAWPGNIRELRNVLERALLLSTGQTLTSSDLRFEASSAPPQPSGGEIPNLQEVERRHIERVLKRCNYTMSQAARVLEISRTTLYQKLKNHSIERPGA